MRELAIVLFVMYLVSSLLVGCSTREEKPRYAYPLLEQLMWDEMSWRWEDTDP